MKAHRFGHLCMEDVHQNFLRPGARGRVTRQQSLVLEPVGRDKAGPSAGMPQAG